MFKVNVAPDMGMYNLLRSQGYDPAYALAEFVDNALQAHMQARPKSSRAKWAPLKVDIRFYTPAYTGDDKLRQSIVVEDNGPGIQKDALNNAMKPARPSATAGLSEFGIGMKASAVWFSDTWSLKTSPVGDVTEYSLDFQLQGKRSLSGVLPPGHGCPNNADISIGWRRTWKVRSPGRHDGA
jgi:hypothetical protein